MPPMVPPEVPPNWSVYFAVDDAQAATAYALEAGASVLMGVEDERDHRIADGPGRRQRQHHPTSQE